MTPEQLWNKEKDFCEKYTGDCIREKDFIRIITERNKLSNQVQVEVKPAYDVADIKIKAKLMENKYWLNFLTLDTTNIIHKSCLKDRITELEKIQNENRKSV